MQDVLRTCYVSSLYTDINECNTTNSEYEHNCTHICNNTEGSYECLCMDGYELDVDGRNCTGKGVYGIIAPSSHLDNIDIPI